MSSWASNSKQIVSQHSEPIHVSRPGCAGVTASRELTKIWRVAMAILCACEAAFNIIQTVLSAAFQTAMITKWLPHNKTVCYQHDDDNKTKQCQ